LIKGFKDFLLRGNVIDLAVAVVIGAAFSNLVNAFKDSFLTPLINLVGGGGQFGGQFSVDGQPFTWGAFLSQVVSFLLTAAVIYFVVVYPMRKLLERRRRGEETAAVPPTQLELLAEIRDLLRAQHDLAPASEEGGRHARPAGSATPTLPARP
jgi:large conductance mechanosensitive channel